MIKDNRLQRLSECSFRVLNPHSVDATLFANDDVPVETAAITELIELLELQQTVERIAEKDRNSFDSDPALLRAAVTPDFHKGAGVPVGTVLATRGFVVPAAIGNDINCGMRLHLTTMPHERVVRDLDRIESKLRHAYFEGGRNIPMSRVQRQALLCEGLQGLLNSVPKKQVQGIWQTFHRLIETDIDHVERRGSLTAGCTQGLDGFLGQEELSRDNQIGSIGGGNHFVEIQRVEKIFDRATAHAWGIKIGMVAVMVHTGSVSIGHHCGGQCKNLAWRTFPQNLKHPENGVFVLPVGEKFKAELGCFSDSLQNAANFAFANRMMLALMAIETLHDVCGETSVHLLYDAPHNMVWEEMLNGERVFIHRKGACPSRGFESMEKTPFAFHGEPVLVPGSMGASSFILAGSGNGATMQSASHGAGRSLSRGDALKGHDAEFQEFMNSFRVVTPVDFRRQDVKRRRDIVDKKLEDIKKEAPFAYKGIGAVIRTLSDAKIAKPVAELKPIMTVKG